MKSIIGILLCAMMPFMVVTEDKQETTDLALARVDKISGKYIFLNAEPVAEYEVAFMVEIKVIWDNSQMNSLDKIANLVLNKAFKTAEKEGKEFDGLIIKSGQKQDLAIRFKK